MNYIKNSFIFVSCTYTRNASYTEILKTKKLSKNINTYIFSYKMSDLQNVHYAFLACLTLILKIPKQTKISEPGRSDITN